jgi:hypothetical protein
MKTDIPDFTVNSVAAALASACSCHQLEASQNQNLPNHFSLRAGLPMFKYIMKTIYTL